MEAGKRLIQGCRRDVGDGQVMQVSIQMLAPRALERLGKQLDSSNEMVAQRAAVWINGSCGSYAT